MFKIKSWFAIFIVHGNFVCVCVCGFLLIWNIPVCGQFENAMRMTSMCEEFIVRIMRYSFIDVNSQQHRERKRKRDRKKEEEVWWSQKCKTRAPFSYFYQSVIIVVGFLLLFILFGLSRKFSFYFFFQFYSIYGLYVLVYELNHLFKLIRPKTWHTPLARFCMLVTQ